MEHNRRALIKTKANNVLKSTKPEIPMKYLTERPEWVTFYPKVSSSFYIEKAGYFDERPEINTSATQLIILFLLPFLLLYSIWLVVLTPFLFFGWGKLYIHLPIKTGIQDCESAAWGFDYHDNKVWFYIGGGGNFEGGKKWKTITMPWDLTWVRTSLLLNDMKSWVHEVKGNRLNFYNECWKNPDLVFIETYLFTDKFDGTVVNATIRVKEQEWRPLWFKWTKLFAKVRKSIEVEFDKEVGKRKGSWKGGTLGCGYEILPDETPYECLKRMERERDF